MLKTVRLTIFCSLLSLVSVAQVNLSNGLVAYYPFNGTFNDASGNGNHGTAMNGASFGADPWGNLNNAASFDGINDWISVPAAQSLTPGRKFSLAFRFRTNSAAFQVMLSKSNYSGGPSPLNLQYQVGINGGSILASNGLFFSTNHNGSCATGTLADHFSFGSVPNANQWYCVVLTFDNGVKKVYMNGALISTTTVTGKANNSSVDSCNGGTFRIGTWWQNDTKYFSGLMDELRVWDRPINTQEIDSICNLVTAPATTTINRYAAITSASQACSNTFVVDDATGFGVGDTVVMIQMKGATIDSSNSSSFGTILNYNGAGNYEFNVVSGVSGNAITLGYALTKTYNIPNGKVQLVRVPYFQNYTVSQALTAAPWNGSKGGVLVLNAAGTVTMNAPIDVSNKGFRSGALVNVPVSSGICGQMNYYYASSPTSYGAEKGEGIAELSAARKTGRGAQASGGGGGNSSNSGGAGGGNAGAGGHGGKESAIAICQPSQAIGGDGGKPISYSNALNKVFMGGGAGAGHANNGEGGNGQPGGGIVILMANQLHANGYAIINNGGDGIGCVGDCWDGQPGGSAGGAVLLNVNSYTSPVSVNARGGIGASQGANNSASGHNGPGGGGGGGALWVKGATMPAMVSASLAGGARGVFLNTNDPWGSVDGQPGSSLTGLSINFPTTPYSPTMLSLGNDTTLCPGDTITLNAGSNGIAYAYNTGAVTSGTRVATSGTYSVAVTYNNGCVLRDTILVNAQPAPLVKLGNDTTICPGASITLNGGAFGSGYAYRYSNNAATQTTAVTSSGTYSLRVTNLTTGCRGYDTIVITQATNPAVNLGGVAYLCPGKTVTLNAGNAGSSYLYNTGATTQTIVVSTPGTYSVRVTNPAKCIGRDTIDVLPATDPVVWLGNDTAVCADSAVTVDAGNAGSTYQWSTGGNTRTHSLMPAGTYVVVVTNPQGCIGRDTIAVSLLPKASVSTIYPARSGNRFAFSSDATNATSYQWSFGDQSGSADASAEHSYATNGVYNVLLIVTNYCGSDTAWTTVTISGLSAGRYGADEDALSVYPNPSSTVVTLDNRSAARMQSVTVFNNIGAVVLRDDRPHPVKASVDVRSLPAGIYMFRIMTDAGIWHRSVQVIK